MLSITFGYTGIELIRVLIVQIMYKRVGIDYARVTTLYLQTSKCNVR